MIVFSILIKLLKYKMKFYNPFRWHIVEQDSVYYIRKWTMLGWAYLCGSLDLKIEYFTSAFVGIATLDKAIAKIKALPLIKAERELKRKIKIYTV